MYGFLKQFPLPPPEASLLPHSDFLPLSTQFKMIDAHLVLLVYIVGFVVFHLSKEYKARMLKGLCHELLDHHFCIKPFSLRLY
jgi:hypothetical protein